MESFEERDVLFEYATEGILIANSMGEIVRINPSSERLFGYEKNELIGKKIETLIPNRFTHNHISQRENFNQNPHARHMGTSLELWGKRKDNSEFPVEVSLSPYNTSQGKYVIAFIIDITQRRAAEEKSRNFSLELEKQVENRTLILREAIAELEKTKEELNNALIKEKELNDLKTRFVSMASHEFRTPLATILSSLSLVTKYREHNDKEKQAKHIARIKTSVNNLTDILNDILSISKLEEGKISASFTEFNIKSFASEVIQELQTVVKSGQTISYKHTGKVTTVVLDRKIVRHILFNLVSNAIKFSAENKRISITTDISGNTMVLKVKDAGIGISEEDQQHLFERFFRGQNASSIQGTGLGLNIVGKYVEMLSGNLEFTSKLEQGTTFTITLPIN